MWQDSKSVSLQCDKFSHSLSVSRRKEANCRRYNPGARRQFKLETAHFKMCFTTSLCVVRTMKSVNFSAFFSVFFFLREEYLVHVIARALSVTVHANLLTGNTFCLRNLSHRKRLVQPYPLPVPCRATNSKSFFFSTIESNESKL